MYKFITPILVLSLFSCGKHHAAKDGHDGQSSLCSVKDKVLTCVNPDGTTSELEIKDGVDGSASVVAVESCVAKLIYKDVKDPYQMTYNLANFASGELLASLSYRRLANNSIVFQTSNLFTKDDLLKEKAKLESPSWSVEKVEGKAVLTHKPTKRAFTMVCK